MAVNITYVLPAGDYRPAYEDATGIYYEAPGKILLRENFLGIQLIDNSFDGGIFLERANPQVAKTYGIYPKDKGGEIQRMMRGGRPGKPTLPREPIQFQLR